MRGGRIRDRDDVFEDVLIKPTLKKTKPLKTLGVSPLKTKNEILSCIKKNMENIPANFVEITEHIKELKEFCADNNLKVVPSDKSKRNVLMDYENYITKGLAFIGDSKDYLRCHTNPCDSLAGLANKMFKKVEGTLHIKKGQNEYK